MARAAEPPTAHLDPRLHKAVRLKAAATSRLVSNLVIDAVREALRR